MHPAKVVVILAMVFCGYGVSQLFFGDREVVRVPDPRWAGEPVSRLRIDLPPIEEFDHYYGGDLNPFVPYAQREVEQKSHRRPPSERRQRPVVEVPPSEASPDQQPDLTVPEFSPPSIANMDLLQVPQVVGTIAMGRRQVLLVEHGGMNHQVRTGEALGEWQLTGIEEYQALFRNQHGEIYRVPIGEAIESNSLDPSLLKQPDPGGDPDAEPAEEEMSTDELLQAVLRNRNNPEKIHEILSVGDRKQRLLKDPTVQDMLEDPMMRGMVEQFLK